MLSLFALNALAGQLAETNTWDIGSNALSAIIVLAGIVTTIVQSTRSAQHSKRSADAASTVAKQTERNGGSTLRDAIDRIEQAQRDGKAAAKADLATLAAELRAEFATVAATAAANAAAASAPAAIAVAAAEGSPGEDRTS